MLRITNLTDKSIDITKSVVIKPRSYLDVQTSITPRLYQLMNMNIIKIQEITDKSNTYNGSSVASEGSLRRKQTMERIRNGETRAGIPLDVSLYKQSTTIESTRQRRNKKVNK